MPPEETRRACSQHTDLHDSRHVMPGSRWLGASENDTVERARCARCERQRPIATALARYRSATCGSVRSAVVAAAATHVATSSAKDRTSTQLVRRACTGRGGGRDTQAPGNRIILPTRDKGSPPANAAARSGEHASTRVSSSCRSVLGVTASRPDCAPTNRRRWACRRSALPAVRGRHACCIGCSRTEKGIQ
jgi:hypothetical protein